MLSRQDVTDILAEPKIAETKIIDLANIKTILNLYSENDDKLKFKLQITQSDKIQFKLTNHHHFNTVGLLRLDYKGRHKNPENITENVPDILHKYVGKIFDINEPHIHIYFEGYDIKWAMPLDEYGFPVKKISSVSDIEDAVKSFQKEINLKSELSFSLPLFR
ncbi:DUF6978 family protein [Desulfonema magnum]|uniref:Uncharacterized protein n=1 Tax=Desulfonema magnum TaxID=45655 RepID=A0A975GQI2_9BACT|nr:hypothetical protein [Desulfonema magnum]QTA88978.1 Uncharacterized protein dnm_050230 [Desulfonema magnum]